MEGAVLVYFFVCHSAFSDFLGCGKQILILYLFSKRKKAIVIHADKTDLQLLSQFK